LFKNVTQGPRKRTTQTSRTVLTVLIMHYHRYFIDIINSENLFVLILIKYDIEKKHSEVAQLVFFFL